MDSWVGGIKMAHFKLWLTTPDGSRCVINDMESYKHMFVGQFEKRDNVRMKFITISFAGIY